MSARLAKWTAAFAGSAVLHAGAVGLFLMPSDDGARIAGGVPVVELSILGNALEDQVSAGENTDAVAPTQADAVEPTDAAEPVETEQAVASVDRETLTPEPVAPVEPRPVQTEVQPDTETVPPEPVEAEQVTPQETPPAEAAEAVRVDEAAPVETEAAAAPEPETLAPLPEDELALVDIPLPTPRPAYTPPPPPRRAEAPARREQPRQTQQAAPRAQGSGGQNQADARRGTEAGGASGTAASAGQAQQTAAGNAAVSNYPGQVASRLHRSVRYPRAAEQQRIHGEVHVRFTVTSGGGVSGISVARSSGSAILDEAAIAAVQRASPFPAIPAAAGRSTWPFTVPLVFSPRR